MNNVQQINIEEIQKKLVDGISDTDWYGLLNHFINSLLVAFLAFSNTSALFQLHWS